MSLGSSPTKFMLTQSPQSASANLSNVNLTGTPKLKVRSIHIPGQPESPTLHPVATPMEEPMTPMALEDS
jgi:hypothetical protein